MTLALAETMTIPALARTRGIPRRTLFRRLLRLYRADKADPTRDHTWLHRYAEGAWRVNTSRLRLAHPELFDVPPPGEVYEQLLAVERYGRETRRRVDALGSAFREHGKQHREREARG